MARPREFDLDTVTDRALDVFWREGYACASLSDLERATGVGRKGLYNTFGSKEGLFLEALSRYMERAVRLILTPLEAAGAGRAAIGHVLGVLASEQGQLKENRGCLVCLTAETEAEQTEEIDRSVQGYLERLRLGFAHAIHGAVASGEVAADKDPDALADFFLGTVMGLSAMARAGRPRAQIQHYVGTALAALD